MAEHITADGDQRRELAETLPARLDVDKVIGKLENCKRQLLASREKVQAVEEPDWWKSNPAASVRARVEEAMIRIQQLSVAIQAFARRQDPDRQVVYFDILCIWERDCAGKLTFSRDPYSDEAEPTGELIEYFERAANFILGHEAPQRHGIADIIKQYRKRDRLWPVDLIVEAPKLGTPTPGELVEKSCND